MICVNLGVANGQFLTVQNLFDLLTSYAFVGILALGLLVVLIAGGIDISFTATASVALWLARAVAKAYGGHGERVETTEEFAPAFERAVKSGKPAILHCLLDPEAISASRTLTELRDAALAKK